MRVFVQVWCEIDPTLNVRVDRATGLPIPDEGDVLRRVSPLGKSGVAAALTLCDARVTAFALGAGHEQALRHALAAGVERAVELRCDPDTVSLAALADWLRQADLVVADRLAGLVAARLGWSHLAGLADLEVRDGVLHAVRHLPRGDRETVTARLPVAVRLDTSSPASRYVTRSRLAAVAQLAIESVTLSEPGTPPVALGPLEAARPRTRLGATAPAKGSASSRLQSLLGGGKGPRPGAPVLPKPTTDTPDQMAEEFARYLRHHGLLPETTEGA